VNCTIIGLYLLTGYSVGGPSISVCRWQGGSTIAAAIVRDMIIRPPARWAIYTKAAKRKGMVKIEIKEDYVTRGGWSGD
jgi:hypothetical protein